MACFACSYSGAEARNDTHNSLHSAFACMQQLGRESRQVRRLSNSSSTEWSSTDKWHVSSAWVMFPAPEQGKITLPLLILQQTESFQKQGASSVLQRTGGRLWRLQAGGQTQPSAFEALVLVNLVNLTKARFCETRFRNPKHDWYGGYCARIISQPLHELSGGCCACGAGTAKAYTTADTLLPNLHTVGQRPSTLRRVRCSCAWDTWVLLKVRILHCGFFTLRAVSFQGFVLKPRASQFTLWVQVDKEYAADVRKDICPRDLARVDGTKVEKLHQLVAP